MSFTPSPGADIPKAAVTLAMWPYIDTAISVIGVEKGWFHEVGITLPNGTETRSIAQTFADLNSRAVDVASAAMSTNLQTYAESPSLKMFVVTNSYLGNYVMASPSSGARTHKALAGSGQDFTAVAKSTVGQMKGKRVAFSENGSTPAFFNTALKLVDVSGDDLDLVILNDLEIVERAKAGVIDYAVSGTAPQSIELMNLGFYRIFGVTDLIDGLPAGDPNAIQGITHVGYRAREDYINANLETVLRFMAVQFRIVDAIQQDPYDTLSVLLPTMRTLTGEEMQLEDAVKLFELFYVPVSFEEAGQLMLDPSHKLYYETVYKLQIAAAKAAGAMPGTLAVVPDDILVYKRLYQILVELKDTYDELQRSNAPTGRLADEAASHYENRNYLDAYRLLCEAAQE